VGEAIVRQFTLTSFAAFLGEAAVALPIAEHRALEHAAVIVETEAKRVIGTYDYGWPQLADATQADRVAKGFSPNDPGLRSGAMRDSIERTVLAHEAQIGSNDEHLVWFDQGTSKQPPRSVLMGAAVHKEVEVVHAIGRTLEAHLAGSALPKLTP
jgi:hypothetical protein